MLDSASDVPSPSYSAPAVLLVEAEPMLRRTMTKFLRRSGCRVTACADGVAGVAALSEGLIRPALIVLGARVIDAQLTAAAHQLHELAPRARMLGIADAVGDEAGRDRTAATRPPIPRTALRLSRRAARGPFLPSRCRVPASRHRGAGSLAPSEARAVAPDR